MKRRSFLQAIGGAIAAVFAPMAKAPSGVVESSVSWVEYGNEIEITSPMGRFGRPVSAGLFAEYRPSVILMSPTDLSEQTINDLVLGTDRNKQIVLK